jgi:hypothetical protein
MNISKSNLDRNTPQACFHADHPACRFVCVSLNKSFVFFVGSKFCHYNEKGRQGDTNLLVILILLLGLSSGLGNTVQITLASLGDAAATLVLVLLKDTNLLKGLHDLAVDGTRGVDVSGGARATVLGGAVDLAEAANTNSLAEVDVAGNGGGADVEPVNVLRRELLGGAGLDGINPTCREKKGDLSIG